MNDLDQTLQQFVDRGARAIPVPSMTGRPAARRSPVRRGAVVATSALLVLLLGSTAALGQNWFSEVFRAGNISAAGSRPVSLAEARTTGLPLPSSRALPGGWALHDRGAVQLTRTPEWTTVNLQYDRGGKRGMNITTASGVGLFDPSRVRYQELLTVDGVTVYVSRESPDAFPAVRAFFALSDVQVEIWAFGPALAGGPLTSDEIAELVRIWAASSTRP
jgi:hypothetical protein